MPAPADPKADAVERVLKFHQDEPDGSATVFISGVDSKPRCIGLIRSEMEELKKRDYRLALETFDVYTLHAKMKEEDQDVSKKRNDFVDGWRDRDENLSKSRWKVLQFLRT